MAWKATRWLVEIIERGFELVIVHGNGPQVGNIMIQVEEAVTKIPPQTLDVCGAQTQGSMGYMLANQLRKPVQRGAAEQADRGDAVRGGGGPRRPPPSRTLPSRWGPTSPATGRTC